jgi:hypothetical protein
MQEEAQALEEWPAGSRGTITQQESRDRHHGHHDFPTPANRGDRGGSPHVTATTVTTIPETHQTVETVETYDSRMEEGTYIMDNGYLLTFLSS